MKLFSQYKFRHTGKESKNRIALAPLTNLQSNDDGSVSPDEHRWLVRRAKEGFGVIITCASHVSIDGQGWKGEMGIFSDDHLEGLTKLATDIRSYGSLAIVQLFHGGARSPESLTGRQPWSASAHSVKVSGGTAEVREAGEDDIERVMNDFRSAALRAAKAGFDGVEIHAAHGYLLHQFLSTFTNNRNDKWGGSADNRAAMILSILRSIRNSAPEDFICGVRISPEDKYGFRGIDFDESLYLSEQLAREGADYVHVSPWDAFKKPEKYPDDEKRLITYFREILPPDVAVIVAGQIWSAEDAERALGLGADFVALGKAAIGIPDWPSRAYNNNFIPNKPPYSVRHLKEADLGDAFIEYMRRWEGFVED